MSDNLRTKKLKTIKQIKTLSDYDFVDLGSGDGASLVNNERIIGGKGFGIELDKKKVKKAVELDREVYLGSALDLHKIKGKVKFTTCDNFLEHLLSFDDVNSMLDQASRITEDFLYIRHPSFEDIEYLESKGLKTFWSHWHGHTAMLRVEDILKMLWELGIYNVKVVPVYKIKDSNDSKILPLSAPIDQHDYDESAHGKKPKVSFDRDVYYAFDIIATMPGKDTRMPTLEYKDRMNQTRHPKFKHPSAIDDLNTQLKDLRRENRQLKSRRVIRYADRLKSAARRLKI